MNNNIFDEEALNSIEFISQEDVNNMNFFEACLYLEKLNILDELTSNGGEKNE